jgi:hypothetical protein
VALCCAVQTDYATRCLNFPVAEYDLEEIRAAPTALLAAAAAGAAAAGAPIGAELAAEAAGEGAEVDARPAAEPLPAGIGAAAVEEPAAGEGAVQHANQQPQAAMIRGSRGRRASGKTSCFRGVSWDTRRQQYCVTCMVHGRQHFVGWYGDEYEAAKEYDRALLRLGGLVSCSRC